MAATKKYRLRVCLRQLPLITLDWMAHSLFVCVCLCVCVFQRHRHLRYRFRRGVPDGGGGGPVPVRVHVHEERARSAGRRLQHLLHQHCEPGLPRWVKDQGVCLSFNNTGLHKEMKMTLIDVHKCIYIQEIIL